ncbi:heterodimeric geranylgeranyl pyrophosphate synthase small subunit, chloroplastic-like [Salvia divinorum]|uniref:Heterodimeric geranylgeranyl pyrophosphate synthase small subunit, chloroplastic-like n=1 Tax=Salvia divinorum TaxID=28513 RepID=A0ABD1G143_SALDI
MASYHSISLHNTINLPHVKPNSGLPSKLRPNLSHSMQPRRIKASVVAQSQPYWRAIESEIDTFLDKSIPVRHPEAVFEPMRHLTFAAPRTAASALCVAACELVGGDRSHAMAAAAAVHLVHAAAYAHEHLPLTDRPRPEAEHKYGPNIELLTGDGIVPFGFELLSRSVGPARPERILRVMIEISRAGGSKGIIDGLYKEEEIVDQNSRFEFIEYVCKKKYGEIHACAAASGAILGGGSDGDIQKLWNFGLYAGTVRGLLERKGGVEIENIVRKLRDLALKELEGFHGKKNVEIFSSLVAEPSLCSA